MKPDAVRRGLVGEIITRFERAGFEIIAAKVAHATPEMVRRAAPNTPEWFASVGQKTIDNHKVAGCDPRAAFGTDVPEQIGRIVRERVVEYLSSGPVFAMVLQGEGTVAKVRRMVGHTFPNIADPGTIRGDYSSVSGVQSDLAGKSCENLVHASSDGEEVERDIASWFSFQEGARG